MIVKTSYSRTMIVKISRTCCFFCFLTLYWAFFFFFSLLKPTDPRLLAVQKYTNISPVIFASLNILSIKRGRKVRNEHLKPWTTSLSLSLWTLKLFFVLWWWWGWGVDRKYSPFNWPWRFLTVCRHGNNNNMQVFTDLASPWKNTLARQVPRSNTGKTTHPQTLFFWNIDQNGSERDMEI